MRWSCCAVGFAAHGRQIMAILASMPQGTLHDRLPSHCDKLWRHAWLLGAGRSTHSTSHAGRCWRMTILTCSASVSLHGWRMGRTCSVSHPPAGCCWVHIKPQVCHVGRVRTVQHARLKRQQASADLSFLASHAAGRLLLGSPDRAVHLGCRLMQLSLDALTVHRCCNQKHHCWHLIPMCGTAVAQWEERAAGSMRLTFRALSCRTAFASQLAAPRRALTDHSSKPAVLTELLIILSGERAEVTKPCLHLLAAEAGMLAACSLFTVTLVLQAGMHGHPYWVQTQQCQHCMRCMPGSSSELSCTAAWRCCSRLPFPHQLMLKNTAALQYGRRHLLARRPCNRLCLRPRRSRRSSPAGMSQVQ